MAVPAPRRRWRRTGTVRTPEETQARAARSARAAAVGRFTGFITRAALGERIRAAADVATAGGGCEHFGTLRTQEVACLDKLSARLGRTFSQGVSAMWRPFVSA